MSTQLAPMHQCSSWELFEKRVTGSKGDVYYVRYQALPPSAEVMYGYTCTCQGFLFSKKSPKTCKHIKEVQENSPPCLWHEQFDAEDYKGDGKCPRCADPVQSIIVAV